MSYDPFERGPYPVGVRTTEWTDAARGGRRLAAELWYPAPDDLRGQDLIDPVRDRYELLPGLSSSWQAAVRDAPMRTGERWPLVVFSHGFGGHRRQSTFLCTHLASHGYAVAAIDHTGNTVVEMVQAAMAGVRTGRSVQQMIDDRPGDLRFAIERALAELPVADPARVGAAGHSFGGYTVLRAIPDEPRIAAALALAPAGGRNPVAGDNLYRTLRWQWDRSVPTQLIVADLDSVLPLSSMPDLVAGVGADARVAVIERADHMHFCDAVERVHELFRMMPRHDGVPIVKDIPPFDTLCPAAHGYDTVRALGLAHFDAYLRDRAEARAFVTDGWLPALRSRGIAVRGAI